MSGADRIKIDEGEKIVLKVRKHWMVLVRDTAGTTLLGLLPFIIIPIILRTVPSLYFDAIGGAAMASFASALWLLVVWMALFTIWVDYYLDIWIITNMRIFNLEQISLFDRRVATWGLEKVQEITVHSENALQALLGYGSLEIQTAGHTNEYAKIEGIPDPNRVRTVILQQIGHSKNESIK